MERSGCNSHNGDGVVVKDRRDIFGWEFVGRVGDKQACLSDCAITDNHASGESQSL